MRDEMASMAWDPAARIGGCLLVIFRPATKCGSAGLELRVVETVVIAGVDDLLDRHPVSVPQASIFWEQSAAGVHSSRAPIRMSVGFQAI